MKRFIIMVFVLMAAYQTTSAQLTVTSQGTTLTKRISASFYNTDASNATLVGIKSSLHNIGQIKGLAMEGYTLVNYSDNINDRIAIGVKGRADGGLGRNYGVYGECIPLSDNLNYGAAIYGTYKSTPRVLSDNYAGYFDGRVEVSEGLIVNGFLRLNGSLLSPTSNSNNFVEYNDNEDRSGSQISSRLSNLKMGSFFLDVPQSTYAESAIEDSNVVNIKKEQPKQEAYLRKHYGLSINQLEEVFPDLVYEDEDGTKSINYVEMVPILVQAINELKSEINELKGNDGSIKETKAQTTGNDGMGENVTMLTLGQNKPNPFGTSTSIEVSIPEDVQSAFIYVYDLTGKKLQQVDIPSRGKQAITINASSLADGMYLYSLIADGKVVETRRMIVEK